MKLSKSILAAALFLAFTGFAASAAPMPDAATPEIAAAEAQQPTDVFGASVLSGGDCGDAAAKRSVSGDPLLTCGQCSQNPCKGASVGDFCGQGPNGTIKLCQDWFIGTMCLEGDGVHCRCASYIP